MGLQGQAAYNEVYDEEKTTLIQDKTWPSTTFRPWQLAAWSLLLRNVFSMKSVHMAGALLPSFVPTGLRSPGLGRTAAPPTTTGSSSSSTISLRGISTLDGLRGLACLIVVNEHLSYNFSTALLFSPGDGGKYQLIQLPFIHMFWNGKSMVDVFFVISGYVLSYKPLRQLHARDFDGARTSLMSATFRRFLRLYLPVYAAMLMIALMSYFGVFNMAVRNWETEGNKYGLHEDVPRQAGSLWLQLKDVFQIGFGMLRVLTNPGDEAISGYHYDPHTWTIPAEFKCSILLFAALTGLSQTRMAFRWWSMAFIAFLLIWLQERVLLLFFAGALLADLDHLIRRRSAERVASLDDPDSVSPKLTWIALHWLRPHSYLYVMVFIFGWYLLSVPIFGWGEDMYFRGPIALLVPWPQWSGDEWFRIYGATMMVWAAANSTILAPIFVNRISTYLGKVSYSLYLVHGTLLRLVINSSIVWIYGLVSADGEFAGCTSTCATMAYVVGLVGSIPLCFWIADLFLRMVEIPAVRFTRWLEARVRVEPEEGEEPVRPCRLS